MVFDNTCTFLGYPDGGFRGRGSGKVRDFEKEAIKAKVTREAKNA